MILAALLAVAPLAVADEVIIEPAEPAAEAVEQEVELAGAEAAPEAPKGGPQNVWWGNRSIAFGNYIKFDKAAALTPCVHGCYEPCGSCPECNQIIFDKIFFDLDKAVLRPEGRVECDRVVAYMNALKDIDVIVQGHTCDLAPDAYNVALGQRRADAVKTYLLANGIDKSRVSTRTFGEAQPWVGLEQRELNRRAIVIVVPQAK